MMFGFAFLVFVDQLLYVSYTSCMTGVGVVCRAIVSWQQNISFAIFRLEGVRRAIVSCTQPPLFRGSKISLLPSLG